MRKIRCKFVLQSMEHFSGNVRKARFFAVSSAGSPENEQFAKFTPSGNLEVLVDNVGIFDLLEPGLEFYLDLIPCEQSAIPHRFENIQTS